jgi:hypothetical protein
MIKTIKRWVWVERKTKSSERLTKESPTKTDDDLCDVLKLIIQAQPRFVGNVRRTDAKYYEDIEDFEDRPSLFTGEPLDKRTGY